MHNWRNYGASCAHYTTPPQSRVGGWRLLTVSRYFLTCSCHVFSVHVSGNVWCTRGQNFPKFLRFFYRAGQRRAHIFSCSSSFFLMILWMKWWISCPQTFFVYLWSPAFTVTVWCGITKRFPLVSPPSLYQPVWERERMFVRAHIYDLSFIYARATVSVARQKLFWFVYLLLTFYIHSNLWYTFVCISESVVRNFFLWFFYFF